MIFQIATKANICTITRDKKQWHLLGEEGTGLEKRLNNSNVEEDAVFSHSADAARKTLGAKITDLRYESEHKHDLCNGKETGIRWIEPVKSAAISHLIDK